jgi:hypothetical protein
VRDCSWLLRSQQYFEHVRPDNFSCSSDRTDNLPCGGYNCIAWAAGKTDRWWWPINDPCAFWPIPIDPIDPVTLPQFIKAFESEGYAVCMDWSYEKGFEKVAIYVDSNDEPTHAARLLPGGVWTSKMGNGEDIEHSTLQVVEGQAYGRAKAFLRRPDPKFGRPNALIELLNRLFRIWNVVLKGFQSPGKGP